LKYRRDIGLGDALSTHLVPFLKTLDWTIDMVAPVPLSNKRLKERGYNQIALVAHPFSLQLGLAYSSRVLLRKKHTLSQVGLSAIERKKNVEGAFWAEPKLAAGKSILLMDDVATTGSTLASAAIALVEAGASRVYAITLARALSHHGFDLV
jgi:ComF family protein